MHIRHTCKPPRKFPERNPLKRFSFPIRSFLFLSLSPLLSVSFSVSSYASLSIFLFYSLSRFSYLSLSQFGSALSASSGWHKLEPKGIMQETSLTRGKKIPRFFGDKSLLIRTRRNFENRFIQKKVKCRYKCSYNEWSLKKLFKKMYLHFSFKY